MSDRETTLTDHPNAATLKRGYDAWATGDSAPLLDACAEEIVWQIAGQNKLAGEHKGRAAMEDVLRQLVAAADGSFCTTYEGVFANDAFGLVVTGSSGVKDGKPLSWRVFDVFKFNQGKIVSFWTFASPQENSDAVWS